MSSQNIKPRRGRMDACSRAYIPTSSTDGAIYRERFEQTIPLGAPTEGRRYTELKSIGIGGQGEVFRGYDTMLNRWVAVKYLHRKKLGCNSAMTDFAREARIQGSLSLSGVPKVHDFDRNKFGLPFIAMELVQGQDMRLLLHLLRQRDAATMLDYPIEQLVKFLSSLARTTHRLHEAGFVHADVKPENILIDRYGETQLVDFGAAQLRSDKPCGDASTTFVGSPAYASPEQIVGHSPTPRSDVYSLGAVLYDCLALDTLIQANSRNEAIRMAVKGIHDPPSQRSLRRRVPAELERICLRAVELDPSNRWRSAGELAVALEEARLDLLSSSELETEYEIQNSASDGESSKREQELITSRWCGIA